MKISKKEILKLGFKLTKSIFLLIVFFILFSNYNQNITTKLNAKTPIYYYADSLIFNNEFGPIRYYYNNVRLIQGNVNISCNLAKYFMSNNSSELSGNVNLKQNDLTMNSPYARYDGNTKISYAWGGIKITQNSTLLKAQEGDYYTENQFAIFRKDVFVEDDTLKLFSDLLHYHRSVNDIEAYGKVLLYGKTENVILSADTLIRKKSEGITKAINNAVLYKIDTVKNNNDDYHKDNSNIQFDTTKISSQKIEVISDEISSTYLFFDSVVINNKDIIAKCDTASFDKELGIIKLLNKPIVWYGNNQLYGDSIIITLVDNKLKNIEAFGNALTVALEDSVNTNLINQLSGENINFSFYFDENENKLDFINSTGGAKSLYFLGDTPGVADAKFNTSGSIKVEFDEGKPDRVLWIDDIEGTIYPFKLIKDTIKEYYLPNFRWSDEKPQTKEIQLR